MNKYILILAFIFSSISFSQTVSTLVNGPSTFDDGIAIDKNGNIYAADYTGTTVTKITHDGNTSIFADGFTNPNGIAFDNDGNLLVPNATINRIDKVTPTGEKSLFLTIDKPSSIYVNNNNSLYIAHYELNKISFVDSVGQITTFWERNGLDGPIGIDFDLDGNMYVGNFNDGKIFKRFPNGEISQIGDLPGWLGFITLAGDNIYATAFEKHKIYKVPIDGSGQSEFLGRRSEGQQDGTVRTASFNGPNGIKSSHTGDTLYITDFRAKSLRMVTNVNQVSDIFEPNNSPKIYELSQNYPNPFNPTTTIKFHIAQKGYYSLKIYNTLGKSVSNLIDKFLDQGDYSIQLNAATLPSGVYIYKLTGNNNAITKKMLLLK